MTPAYPTTPASLMTPAFDYRIDWRPVNRLPGEHPAATRGDGGAFRGERLLLESAQFRRLAIGASLRDPLARWWVQEMQQRSAIDIVLCLDLSASMRVARGGGDGAGDGPAGQMSSLRLLGDLVESTERTARRIGDRVGLVVAAESVDRTFTVMPGEPPGRLLAMASRLRAGGQGAGKGASARGLLDLPRWLPARRSLVLLASDFLGPIAFWARVLAPLASHQVVPLVIETAAAALPEVPRGLQRHVDAETGEARVLWWRPSLRRRIIAARLAHQEALDALFRRRRLRPLRLQPPFDPAQLTAYFHASARPLAGGSARLPGVTGMTEGSGVTSVTGAGTSR